MSKKKILIAPNSFKECADSVTIAKIIESHLCQMENVELLLKPISDGGDGFLKVCHFYFGGEYRSYRITTPYNETIFDCPVLYSKEKKEIYIESAEVLGLKKVPANYRKPIKLSSKGMGELVKLIQQDVNERLIEVDKVIIGIGGTATIDLGLGMMSELGLTLFEGDYNRLEVLPINFQNATDFSYKKLDLVFDVILITDVENPLLGGEGGLRVYGKQKGASGSDIQNLERSFTNLLNLFEIKDLFHSSIRLSGAGGGLAAAFQIFYNSRVLTSKQFILEVLGFGSLKSYPDYLISGEGAYDSQSAFGKGASILVEQYKSKVDKLFLICGEICELSKISLPENVHPIELSSYFTSIEKSIANYELGIEKACKVILNQI